MYRRCAVCVCVLFGARMHERYRSNLRAYVCLYVCLQFRRMLRRVRNKTPIAVRALALCVRVQLRLRHYTQNASRRPPERAPFVCAYVQNECECTCCVEMVDGEGRQMDGGCRDVIRLSLCRRRCVAQGEHRHMRRPTAQHDIDALRSKGAHAASACLRRVTRFQK